ncbi:MAG TPA: PKD domain-containing protein [Bacteroidia bacterium]|nr:PKD domain-containing protein [Bacteroidia bacterium]
MTIKPNTGSTNIFVGDPGVIFVGDVGWSSWEELNRLESKGQNFGWPIFEGLTLDSNYSINNCPHPFANNPLFGIGNCTQSNFYFRELLKEDTLNNPFYSNSCNIVEAIPAYIPKFIHARPLIDWRHYAPPITRVPSFDNGSAKAIGITDMSSPCKGMAFNGNASVPGLWYEKNGFPNEFKEAYYFADYVGGWIRYLKFDSNNNLFEVNHFADTLGLIVYVGESNLDDCIYFIKYPNEIKKICFTGNYNDPPIAKASANIIYGPTPLSVSLDGSGSYDSDGLIVSYYWDFGDGNTSNSISPAHTFIATVGVPTVYKVELTVVDNLGQQSSDSIFVYVNNSPPQINIISFNDGDLYSIVQSSLLNLQAIVTDAEHGPNDLFYTWNTMLHRNSHSYNWDTDTNKLSSVILNPLGCGFDVYRYSISLAVKDVLGLESRVIQNVYPNCLGLNVLDIEYENDLVLYPNPIQDDKVYIKGNFNPKTVTLLDMSGRVAYTSTEIYKLESQLYFFTFNKQSFKSGIYLLQFITTDNKILTKKLVVF